VPLTIETLADADAVARRAAQEIASAAREAIESRGRFTVAFSGGRTPAAMLRALATESLVWEGVHVFQVDERIAPAGDPDRNWNAIEAMLGASGAILHPMPVEDADAGVATARYARELESVCGAPAVLDLVHLGLGADGHTASLVPGDAALDVRDSDVAITGPYQKRRRMTLTFPALDRARRVLWVVTGTEKYAALAKLLDGDPSIPASRVARGDALVLADRCATG